MVENLSSSQKETVLRFLLYHLSQDMRAKLMAEYPVAYGTLYPSVPITTIFSHVSTGILAGRNNGHVG